MGAPPPPIPARPSIPRSFQFVLFCAAGAWFMAAESVALRAGRGIGARFDMGSGQPLLTAVFALFLLLLGFRLLDWIATRTGSLESVAPLPRRAGFATEWATGAAFGWGLALVAVLPLMLSGNLHVRLLGGWSVVRALLASVATLAVLTLVEEIGFRGYLFRRLSAAIGDSWAAVAISAAYGIVLIQTAPLGGALTALAACTLFGLLLTLAYLRTHALWVGWGLNFAYRAVMAVLIGLPVAGHGEFSSMVDAYSTGPRWLSGDAFGLDAAYFTVPVLLVGLAAMYRVTREYAWHYTYRPIVAGGYEVTVAPPAAHVAMEKAAAPAPAPLVQILPVTSQSRSVVEPSHE